MEHMLFTCTKLGTLHFHIVFYTLPGRMSRKSPSCATVEMSDKLQLGLAAITPTIHFPKFV